jgi:predicted nucleotidyltransferase
MQPLDRPALDVPWATLRALVAAQPEQHLFVVVSGSHLYGYPGYPSPDSDVDLRGCHRLPTEELFGLERPSETVERLEVAEGREVETVSQEVEKLLRLMLRRNGTLLEQIFSPLVVVETPALAELKELARGCMTRGLYFHYRSLMQSLWRDYAKGPDRRVKPLIAIFRAAMTAIHVLRRAEIETYLPRLVEEYDAAPVAELIALKSSGEGATVPDHRRYLAEIDRLGAMMDAAYAESPLPEAPENRAAVDAFLRLQRWQGLG